jgi:uncharacterized protein (DUF1800 family)
VAAFSAVTVQARPARPKNLRFRNGTTVAGGPVSAAAAARFLTQATFGPNMDSIRELSSQTYASWFANQAAAAPTYYYPSVTSVTDNWIKYWTTGVVLGKDQLRQRMAFALSQILVVSDQAADPGDNNQALTYYYDILVRNAFGNYGTLLKQVTLSPAMGHYLSMFRNQKANPATGVHADENYAREIMQLFGVGLVMLNNDGTPMTDGSGNPIPSYTQTDVEQLARVFTGWASNPVKYSGDQAWYNDNDYLHPMVPYPTHHDTGSKIIIGGVNIPAGGSPQTDLDTAVDAVFNHPNVAPFISKQLIQRLVTSNPSPAYVQRVSNVFNNNGQGVRGDLFAVAKAILTDPEALNGAETAKLREPLLRLTHLWRAFNAVDSNGKISEPRIVNGTLGTFGESVLESPTVFNFFRPDFQRAGPLTNAGLVVPEFQITNEISLVNTENTLIRQAYQYTNSAGVKYAGYQGYSETGNLTADSVMLQTARWEPLAANPAALVDQLNLVFMSGQMPATMRSSLITYVTAIPATAPWSRVIEAADLIVDSPQYAIQR